MPQSLVFRFSLAAATATLVAGCVTAPRAPVATATPPATAPAPAAPAPAPAAPALVIGHRGASALRPEHTLASYQKAIDDGADIIEPDLVSTKDGVLVARHENDITGTTNVAQVPEFAGRRRIKVIDGERIDGWFTEDFTLAELKTLRARERIPRLRPYNAKLNDQFEIPTFDEILKLAAQASGRRGSPVGIYPELKHPSYFRGIGLPLEEKLVATLKGNAYAKTAPVYVQSFEVGPLRTMKRLLGSTMPNVKIVQLIGSARQRPADWRLAGDSRTYASMLMPLGLREVATYANGIGPEKSLVIPRDAHGRLAAPTPLVANAHAAGLLVHPYTFRPENSFLPKTLRAPGDDATRNPDGMVREVQAFLAAGIDGFFTDDPALGRRAVATPAGQ
ncbi:Glycerophosphoryl diester phosphodiesterase periplasmic (secreted in GramPositives) [Cupriavidus sp. U2]|uniref:glycerophosphodiester phosphodiesterase n=1 Tax=Cupriavidus sp. U2 TaxID=2920269 RepID=UPI00129EB8F5|nr:glycerophosphodiester phosphodiesterase [Cupriavidus sp. U2]KAI3592434.1 Glycerophosphoryl diester phosphodiesterase periplasmic (secreted in GramPositives) [Cupriavidus sp. U2]